MGKGFQVVDFALLSNRECSPCNVEGGRERVQLEDQLMSLMVEK